MTPILINTIFVLFSMILSKSSYDEQSYILFGVWMFLTGFQFYATLDTIAYNINSKKIQKHIKTLEDTLNNKDKDKDS